MKHVYDDILEHTIATFLVKKSIGFWFIFISITCQITFGESMCKTTNDM